jgi:hypothetical protein
VESSKCANCKHWQPDGEFAEWWGEWQEEIGEIGRCLACGLETWPGETGMMIDHVNSAWIVPWLLTGKEHFCVLHEDKP